MILAFLGLLISLYILFAEFKVKQDPSYKAMCDFSDKVSCTKPILSPYGKVFGISNGVLGVLFYTTVIILAAFSFNRLIFFSAVAACIGSLYFGWILITKIRSYCLLCIFVYIINVLLLVHSAINL